MVKTILIIEDDKGVQKYLKELLSENSYSIATASDGVEALSLIKRVEPDLVLLDLGLPNLSGESVCLEIRKEHPNLPIIILTAKDEVGDIVSGLNLGADDYITKPFVADELLARINARLRNKSIFDIKLKVSDLELDNRTLEVRRNGQQIKLTPQELKLLHYLMSNRNRVLTREMILNRIWSHTPDIETRVVDVYLGYLRKKIDRGHKKKLLHSVRGFGYILKEKLPDKRG